MKKLFFILLTAVLLSYSYAQQSHQKATYKVRISFKNTVGDEDMQLGATYRNAFDEAFTIKMFKYYISNIEFKQANGNTLKAGSYHLVNEADTASASFTVNVSDNRFSSISFLAGVDSIRNVSGTQTGDLDPSKGMFWTWNTGYIMAKLEATSSASQNPNNSVSYHIGGFKKGEDVTRKISLDLRTTNSKDDEQRTVSEIVIQANAGKWFNAVHQLKIAEHAACTSTGELAMKFADNYAQMFTIKEVKD